MSVGLFVYDSDGLTLYNNNLFNLGLAGQGGAGGTRAGITADNGENGVQRISFVCGKGSSISTGSPRYYCLDNGTYPMTTPP